MEMLSNELSDFDRQKICDETAPIEETHIAAFHKILEKYHFQPRPIMWDNVDIISPAQQNKELIQIIGIQTHWVCCHYDVHFVYIYDALNKKLTPELEEILLRLFPFIDMKAVRFPEMKEMQSSAVASGVYAIAFAVSCFFCVRPHEVFYDQNYMRNDLYKILKDGVLEHFTQNPVEPQQQVKPMTLAINRRNQGTLYRRLKKLNKKQQTSTQQIKLNNCDYKANDDEQAKTCFLKTSVENAIPKVENAEEEFINKVSVAETTMTNCNVIRQERFVSERIDDQSIEEIIFCSESHDNSNKRQVVKDLKRAKKQITWQGFPKMVLQNLSYDERECIISGKCLTDRHMSIFISIVHNRTQFLPYETFYIQNPSKIRSVPPNMDHIQILPGNGHWICSYYNFRKNVVNVYNSLNRRQLTLQQKCFLQRLHPLINLDNVRFPLVQSQVGSTDCGFFAIAFATSLLFGMRPEDTMFKTKLMREHLLTMMENQCLEPFPIQVSNNDNESSETCYLIPCCDNAEWEENFSVIEEVQTEYTILSNPMQILSIVFSASDNMLTGTCSDNVFHVDEKLREKCKSRYKPKVLRQNDTQSQTEKSSSIDDSEVNETLRTSDEIAPHLHHEFGIRNHQPSDCTGDALTSTATSIITQSQLKQLAAKKIIKKYGVLNNFKICESKEYYIKQLCSKLEIKDRGQCRVEAENIIKWCLEKRKSFTCKLEKTLNTCKDQSTVNLVKLAQCESADFKTKLTALCGISRHCASTEAYFSETAYEQAVKIDESIVLDLLGRALNIMPLYHGEQRIAEKSWTCKDSVCKLDNAVLFKKYRELLRSLSKCSLRNVRQFLQGIKQCGAEHAHMTKLGHPHSCYVDCATCKSTFIAALILAPHFPSVRYIVKLVYSIARSTDDVFILDEALEEGNVTYLQNVCEMMKDNKVSYEHTRMNIELNEEKISEVFRRPLAQLAKKTMNAPSLVCVSCERLLRRDQVREVKKLWNPIDTRIWHELIKDAKERRREQDYVCETCLQYIRNSEMPYLCVLNNLHVQLQPEEVKALNDIEKMLIQRAKAFQVVQKLGTVANKKLPANWLNSKVVGQTIHLPLPTEETLARIGQDHEPLNKNHELHILVRGLPNNKTKKMWEHVVNVVQVYKCLQLLKTINHLYEKIVLPKDPVNLFDNLKRLEFVTEDVDAKDDDETEMNMHVIHSEGQLETGKGFLTQKTKDGQFYEQYTIFPMRENKINETATKLYQQKKVEAAPLDKREKELDLMCFPDLYPEGRDGQHETRLRKIKDSEFIKQRLMNKHPQFRLNIQYLFFLLHDSNIRQINAGIFHKLNVPNPQLQYTAGNYLNMLQNQELERNLNTIHSRLRNTAAYWNIPRNNLRCMVNEYGPATWFVTLSPAEWRWGDLHDYIRKVNAPHLDKMPAGQLIAADPVSTSRFMNNKFRVLMEFICSDEAPLGKIEHYFWRLEYQTRGGHHWHCLMWVKKAPVIGKCTNEEVAEFIMQYVTCAIPDKKISPLLHERVNAHQRHSHNAYCLRCKQTNEKCYKVCRFGFPRNVTDNFVLRDVETSIAGRALLQSKKRLYDVPRVIGEEYINDYNPTILYTLEGNMDIQFVGEVSTAIIEYVLKYAIKPEKSNIDLGALLSTDSSKSLIQRLWAIGTKTLCHRECGALEAADTLLGYPLHGTDPDTTVRWIDINEIRPKKLKQKNEIEKLDKKSRDLFFPNLTDDYYPQRPDELADYCLYDFAKWFDIVYTKPQAAEFEFYEIGKNRYLRKRSRGHLINHYKYKENRDEEKFFFSLLILFQPWRSIEELKNQCKTYAKSFDKVKSTLTKAMEYHQKITELQEAFEAIDKVVQKKIVEDEIEADKKNNDAASLECIPIEAQAAMDNFKDLNENINDVDVDELIAQMNPDQKRVFDKVIQSLQSGTDVLRMYVSGEGGTGKSFLLHAIRCWVKQKMGKDVAVAAPTGIAAFSIQGLTIHKLFQLPVEHGQTPEYRPLTDDALKTLRENLRNVTLFVIDEVSMISNITMMYIHLRLAEIFDTSDKENCYFGGVPILFLGDILQLQPVRANPPYMAITKEEIQKYVKCCGNINLWKELFTYEELTINMRQKGDTAYKELLSRVRIGLLTDDDIKTLSERRVNFRSDTIEGRLGELCNFVSTLPPATVCILPTKHMCAVLNHKMLSLIESEEINLYAIDKTDCAKNKEKKVLDVLKKHEEDYSRSGGLPSVITIKVGCKVMILRNIDVAKGLVNGTIATVTSISRSIYGDDNVDSIKVTVDGIEEHIIERVNVKFEILTKAYVTRHQFPIGLSYAITVHKSQGLSKKSVVLDAGNSMFADGQVYVALSRVTTLEGLHLINFDPHAVKANPQAILEYNRLRTKYRPDLPSLQVADGRADKRVDSRWIADKKVSEIQNKVAKNAEIVDLHYIRGLPNKDNASCYANSTLQCLFNCEKLNRQIRTLPRNNPLHAALRNYTDSRKNVDVKAVRGFVNQLYEASRQQDVTAFITALLKRVESLQPIVQCSARSITSCTNPPCVHSETVINAPMFIIVLPVAIAQKKSVDLQTLLDERYSKRKMLDEDECDKCKHFGKTEKSEIYISSSVVIIQLEIFQEKDGIQTKMGKCLIKGIPTSRIKIDTKTYKVTSAIFHKESKSGGHYTVMIRQKKNKWLEIDNSTIAAKSWPNNAKCAYIFFLEKIENNRLCTKYRKDLPSVQVPVDITHKSVASTQIFGEEVSQIQTNVTENTQIVDLHRCRGLPNPDHVSCYANSTLQCFFHSEQLNRQIRTLPQNNILHDQLRNYIDRSKTVDVYAVRSYVDKIYEAIQQQDVHEFITSLLQKVESLQPIVQYSYNTVLKCVQCNETSAVLEPPMFLVSLPVRLAQEKSVTFQQLLDEEYGEKEELRDEVRCDTCEHTGKTAKLEIFSSSSIVIIQLQLFQNEGAIVRKIDNCVIKEIPSSQIRFGTNQYRVMSAIFHAGTMEAGHYTVMIRQKNNQWLQIDDLTVKDKSWPNEANPPYILFLEKI